MDYSYGYLNINEKVVKASKVVRMNPYYYNLSINIQDQSCEPKLIFHIVIWHYSYGYKEIFS